MSKLVIQTQHKENYGAHDWDGEGSCPQYWKFKGGNTYVVEGLSGKAVNKIAQHGIPTLSLLIESKSDMFEEYILDWSIEEDDAVVCEEWESPIVMLFDTESKLWNAVRVSDNGDMGYMRREILRKTESWTMARGGEQKDYAQTFLMENEQSVNYAGLTQWFELNKEVA